MKYIIAEINSCEVAILFPESIDHESLIGLNPVYAGFCYIETNVGENADDYDIEIHGKIEGLNLESRKEDAEIIRQSIEFRA